MYNAVYEGGAALALRSHGCADGAEAEAFLAARDFLSINITTPYKPEAFACRRCAGRLGHARPQGQRAREQGRGPYRLQHRRPGLRGLFGTGRRRFSRRVRRRLRPGQTSLSILHAVARRGRMR
ncbi:MAG: hypothetical protein ACLUW6_07140 [Coriobacteriaceae bacterium]